MTDINTISLSGTIADNVRKSKAKGVPMARFFLEVRGEEKPHPLSKFEVIASDEWAERAYGLSKGDQIVLVGSLHAWSSNGIHSTEVHVRRLIPLVTLKTSDIDDDEGFEDGEEDND